MVTTPMLTRPFLLALSLAFALTAAARADYVGFECSALTIDTAAGPQRFAVELALTPQQ
jgi:hypothetical protein